MEQLKQQKMTIEEFDKLIEDNTQTYELIDGIVCMSPRPNGRHQKIMFNLSLSLGNHLKGGTCETLTEVELEINKNVIIPDISVFCNLDTVDVQRFKQPPTLVIEILSPSNTAMEIEDKIAKYREHGIKEMWLINPKTKSIEVKNLSNNSACTFIQSGLIESKVFCDLKIELADIFS